MKTIKIGCASGFWGDSMIATPQLLASQQLDYLVSDYLAEITMSILARQRADDPSRGYAHDFVDQVMRAALPEIARQGVKVISNAGGVNPQACGQALTELIDSLGLSLRVAVVTGDDLTHCHDLFRAAGVTEMHSGEPLPETVMSMNAYLGAVPIAQALALGADIVITGRCADSAVTLGPCLHEFEWSLDDYDRLAAGTLAGHIIECGAQATGGLYTDWHEVDSWANVGYPIVEIDDDGTFICTKPDGTDGTVSPATVAEQLVYEIGNPRAYIVPDVVCDFANVQLTAVGKDRVRVQGAVGRPPTETYKVSATYQDGFRITCQTVIRGMDADKKAHKTIESVLQRVERMFEQHGYAEFIETEMDLLGTESIYGPLKPQRRCREVVGRLAAKHENADALRLLLREMTSTATSMAPGICTPGDTRPRPSPVVRLFSFLIDRTKLDAYVHFEGTITTVHSVPGKRLQLASQDDSRRAPRMTDPPQGVPDADDSQVVVPLVRIAHGRSGDKGNDANIGIIARHPQFVPLIGNQLSSDAVLNYFSHLVRGPVERFELPGINAFNFLLHDALGGGGVASLRTDPQGKAYAQMLLEHPVRVPKNMLPDL